MKSFLTSILFSLFFGASVIAQSINLNNSTDFKLRISLKKDTFSITDDIKVIITLTNSSNVEQRVLFDIPRSEIFGPAQTLVSLVNSTTGKSVLKYSNKRILESQLYGEEEMREYDHILKPGQFLIREYSLYDLAVIDSPKNKLGKGTYRIEISHNISFSNSVTFVILDNFQL